MTNLPEPEKVQLDHVISEYLLACEVGTAPSLDTLCERHPDFSVDIRSFFRENEQLASRLRAPSVHVVQVKGYEIVREIGRGGMGVVFEARQLSLGRNVAIKVLRDAALSSRNMRARFEKEAQLIAQLKHDNIVGVIEFGRVDDRPYLVMPVVDGQPLSRLISEEPLRENAAARVMVQVTEAIHFAHSNDVIHRDIKPGNIVGNTDRCQVTDFGLAFATESDQRLTGTGDVIGTPGYLAPEIIRGQTRGNVATEIYALGATFYALLVGQPPHRAATAAESMMLAMQGDPVEPKQLNSTLSTDVNSITMKCLDAVPSRRYQSVSELQSDINSLLQGRPVSAQPLSTLARMIRWCIRNKSVTAAIAALALVMGLLAAGIPTLVYLNHQKQQAEALAAANDARAATQEYYARISEVNDWQSKRKPGWSWKSLTALDQIARLPADGRNPFQLRSLIAEAAIGIDASPVATIGEGKPVRTFSVSPNGQLLAIIRGKGTMQCYQLDCRDEITGKLVRDFGYPEDAVNIGGMDWLARKAKQLSGRDKFGMSAFSNCGRFLVAMRFKGNTSRGELFEWDLTTPDQPGKPLVTEDLKPLHRLCFSKDDRTIFALTREGHLICIDHATGKLHVRADNVQDIVPLEGRELVTTGDGLATFRSHDEHAKPTTTRGRDVISSIDLSASGQSVFAALRSDRAAVVDVHTGREGVEFIAPPKVRFWPHSRVLPGPVDATAVLQTGRNELQLFDALSGQLALSFRGADANAVAAAWLPESDLLATNSSTAVQLHRLRVPRSFGDESVAADDCYIRTMVPSSWRIRSFDIDHEAGSMALLEQDGEYSDFGNWTEAPHTSRVRVIDLKSMSELARYRMASVLPDAHKHRFHGGDVAILGNRVLVGSRFPGFHFQTDETGLRALRKQFNPAVTSSPNIRDDSVRYNLTLPSLPEESLSAYSLTIAVRSRNLPPGTSTLSGTGNSGNSTWNCELNKPLHEYDDGQWQYLQVGLREAKELGRTGTFEVRGLAQTTVTVTTDPKEFNAAESAIQFGSLVVSGSCTQVNPRGLGPVRFLASGDVFVVEDRDKAIKWSDTKKPPAFYWHDAINVGHDFPAMATGDSIALIATIPGQVMRITPDNKIVQITSGPRYHRARASANTPTTLSVSRDDTIGICGNRRGELLLFDLTRESDWQVLRAQHHTDRITAIACTNNGSLVAAADKTGVLRLYEYRDSELHPYFEITTLDNPAIKMMFSPGSDQLYFLCRNEPGLRMLNLAKLEKRFSVVDESP